MAQHTQAIVTSHSQLDLKFITGTPILHVEASFISVERGLCKGILSQTSLKYYIHFSFILKLIIFIYKQLKRHVAFSAVQALVQQPTMAPVQDGGMAHVQNGTNATGTEDAYRLSDTAIRGSS